MKMNKLRKMNIHSIIKSILSMRKIPFCCVVASFILFGCGGFRGESAKTNQEETENSTMTSMEQDRDDRIVVVEFGNGNKYRSFVFERSDSGGYFLYAYSQDNNLPIKVFADEVFEEGWPGMAGFVSPDKRFVYTITDHMPSVSGFPWRLSIYRTDVKTLKTIRIDSGPAIRVEEGGFTIASDAECINPDTCSAAMVYSYRDISYNLDGKQVGRSKRYMDKELENRYGENLINIRGVGTLNVE